MVKQTCCCGTIYEYDDKRPIYYGAYCPKCHRSPDVQENIKEWGNSPKDEWIKIEGKHPIYDDYLDYFRMYESAKEGSICFRTKAKPECDNDEKMEELCERLNKECPCHFWSRKDKQLKTGNINLLKQNG